MANKTIPLVLLAVIAISACASNEEVDNSYVSPAEYQNYNCKQLAAEQSRVSKRIESLMPEGSTTDQTGQVLNAAVMALAITQGYGFTTQDNPNEKQLKRLQSQYDAIEKISIQKSCL